MVLDLEVEKPKVTEVVFLMVSEGVEIILFFYTL